MTDLRAAVRADRGGIDLDLSLHLPPGTTVALLGPNGAGKSTVVGMLAGLVPSTGRITLGDRVLLDTGSGVDVPPERRRIGVVFQEALLFPHLTVAENVAFGAGDGRAGPWLERLGVTRLAGRRPAEISGGEARRVALARTLAAEPGALLLDEPFAGVDAGGLGELRRVVGEHLAAFEGPRLLVTHDPTDVHLLADEVRILEAGRITMVGTPDDVRLRPTTRYAADLAGVNLFSGRAESGSVAIGRHRLAVADHSAMGPVDVIVHPRAVALHAHHPEGTPRNVWLAPVDAVERLGDRVRISLGGPLPVVAEVTEAGAAAIDLTGDVWVSIKATEVTVLPG